jgi:hypothetical protein
LLLEIVVISLDMSVGHSYEDTKSKLPGGEEYCILDQIQFIAFM